MDLIDRYLAAIGALTTSAQRQDITDELRDVLMTRCEEKEAELGRPLNRDEVAEVLRAFGHPVIVAARYGGQRYLIGPEIYPIYILVLKILLGIVAVVAIVTGVVTAAIRPDQPGAAVGAAVGALIQGGIGDVGALTILAALLERQKGLVARFLGRWSPQDLPEALHAPRLRRRTWLDHAAGIAALTVFVLWWARLLPVAIPNVSFVALKAGERLDLARAAVWDVLFWPVLGLALAAIAADGLRLLGKAYESAARGLDLACGLAGMIILWIALRAGHWVEVTGSGLAPNGLAKVDYGVNLGLRICLILFIAGAAGHAVHAAWRLYRAQPRAIRS